MSALQRDAMTAWAATFVGLQSGSWLALLAAWVIVAHALGYNLRGAR
jgi:hypothetical protein